MGMKAELLLCFLTCLRFAHFSQLYEGDACWLESGGPGICVRQTACPAAHIGLGRGVRPKICCFHQKEPVVCCPQRGTTATDSSGGRGSSPRVDTTTKASVRIGTTVASPARVGTTVTASPARFGANVNISTAGVGNLATSPPRNGKSIPPVHGRMLTQTADNSVRIVKRMCEFYGTYAVVPEDFMEEKPNTEDPSSFRNIAPGIGEPLTGRSREVVFRITGGEAAEAGEFPHMAALGWGEKDDILWLCGGSLISERFILTAAHCTQSRGRGLVRWVRLGTEVANETTEHTQLLEVKAIHRHENYTIASYYNDIALLELKRDVNLSFYVRPACLHTEFVGPDHGASTATGWGALNSTMGESLVLMKVDLQFQRTEACNTTYNALSRTRRLNRGISVESMICVGDLNEVKDTCQGDSGGPIQLPLSRPPNMHSIVGVTSFGVVGCGVVRAPAIYSRVSHFLTWIVKIVWPNL